MFSKLSLSISAALVLSASGGVARAAPKPTDADISVAESGIPDSTEYGKRMLGRHSPSNEEINASETGSPDSIDNRDRMPSWTGGNWQEGWQSLELGNPDFR